MHVQVSLPIMSEALAMVSILQMSESDERDELICSLQASNKKVFRSEHAQTNKKENNFCALNADLQVTF